jgi:HAD domain in Swiss Army Knife RNA repair proteins
MILFLDFDGVLHPDPCLDASRLFEQAPLLERTLEPFPEVGIVLSTAWRTEHTLDELASMLPQSLTPRLVGMTPGYQTFRPQPALAAYRRQAECLAWLEQHADAQTPWLALDDRPAMFAPYCEQLVVCHPALGLTEETAARLDGRLRFARDRMLRSVDAQI